MTTEHRTYSSPQGSCFTTRRWFRLIVSICVVMGLVGLLAGAIVSEGLADPPSLCDSLTGDSAGPGGGPANDDFSSAQTITGESGSVDGTLVDATVQTGSTPPEEDSSADGSFDSLFGAWADSTRSVWYCWTAPADGRYVFDTSGSPSPYDGTTATDSPEIDAVSLNGHDDWGDAGTQWEWVGGDVGQDGGSGGHYSRAEVPYDSSQTLSAGDTLVIRIANGPDFYDGALPDEGDFQLNWTSLPYATVQPYVSADPPQVAGVGDTLAANKGTWIGSSLTYSYQWQRCDQNGNDCSDIAGASSLSYTTVSADAGHSLILNVTAGNAGGDSTVSSEYALVPASSGAPSPFYLPDSSPTLSGSPTIGQTLSVAHGVWSGSSPLTYSYQWSRCPVFLSCGHILGASSSTYTVSADDLCATISVVITATDPAGSTPATLYAGWVLGGNNCGTDAPTNSADPSVSGTAQAGSTLTAASGTWSSDSTDTLSYQWQYHGAGCVSGWCDIAGATGTTYPLSDMDNGTTVRVAVNDVNATGSTVVDSAAVGPVSPSSLDSPYLSASTAPDVGWPSGDAILHSGAVLGTTNGSVSLTSLGYVITDQWLRCDQQGALCVPVGHEVAVSSATSRENSSYVVTDLDVGHRIRWVRRYQDSAGLKTIVTHASALVHPARVRDNDPTSSTLPSITGVFADGDTLTANHGTWSGSPTYSYTWLRCDQNGAACQLAPPGSGSTGSTYVVNSNDLGYSIRLAVQAVAGTLHPAGYAYAVSPTYVVFNAATGLPAAALSGPCGDPRYAAAVNVQDACRELAADPVNLATGAVTDSVTDLSLASAGEPFSFTRTYDSMNGRSGELGVGWTDIFETALTLGGNNAVFTSPTGAQILFEKTSGGSYTTPGYSTASLTTVSGGYQIVLASQLHLGFEADGRLTSIKDRNGEGVDIAYDLTGQRSTATDSAGHTATFDYNTAGLLSEIELSDGRTVHYGYTNGILTSVTDARGGTTSYTYDTAGQLATVTDQNSHQTVQNTYGIDGRILSQQDALGNETDFSWNSSTQTETVTDARGHIWQSVFDNNQLVSQVDPLSNTVSYTYDSGTGDLTSYTDALGNTISFTYDSAHNLATRSSSVADESFTYDSKNDTTSHTDGRSNETTYGYDTAGNLTSITRPGSNTTTYGVNSHGLVTSVTDPRGKVTSYGYDSSDELASITAPLGGETTLTHDSSGRLSAATDPRGNLSGATPADYQTSYGYDDASHLTSVTDPLGDETTATYDPAGNLASSTDADGNTTSYTYDDDNHLVTVTASDATTTTYTYDEVGNITSRTDGNGHTTSYTYDDDNHLASETNALSKTWTFSYDDNGNLTETDTPSGGTLTRSYDDLGRLTGISYSDSTPSVSYTYDENGNRTEMTDGSGTTDYTYNNLDELTDSTEGSNSFDYTYNADGDVLSREYPDGTTTNYSYDNNGNLSSASVGSNTTSYSHDAAGRLTETDLPNGVVEARTYDNAGRLAEIESHKSSTTIASNTYTYDDAGNPTNVTTAAGQVNYGYDDRNRVTSACYQTTCPLTTDPKISYAYDAAGNRTNETNSAGTTTYSYNNGDELTSATTPSGTVSYTYNNNGDQTAIGSWTLTYNLANQLSAATHATQTYTYAYNGDGNRVEEDTPSSNTSDFWDTNFTLPQLGIQRNGSTTIRTLIYAGDEPLGIQDSAGWSYLSHDSTGSVVALTNPSGSAVATYKYDPYGVILGTTGSSANPLQFAGQYRDPNTGIDNVRARQYDSGQGRFTTVDPKARDPYMPETATYVYAEDQPTTLIDPSGEGAVGTTCTAFVCSVVGMIDNAPSTFVCELHHPAESAVALGSFTSAAGFGIGGVRLGSAIARSAAPGILAEVSHPVDVLLPSVLQEVVALGTGYTGLLASRAIARDCAN